MRSSVDTTWLLRMTEGLKEETEVCCGVMQSGSQANLPEARLPATVSAVGLYQVMVFTFCFVICCVTCCSILGWLKKTAVTRSDETSEQVRYTTKASKTQNINILVISAMTTWKPIKRCLGCQVTKRRVSKVALQLGIRRDPSSNFDSKANSAEWHTATLSRVSPGKDQTNG